MEEGSAAAASVAQAIAAALDWSSPSDARKAASAYLESVKNGNIGVLASTSLLLVRKDWSPEIRLHGFKMLQHLVRFRWDEFNVFEQRDFANFSINLIAEVVSPHEEWALKSQTAALVAEVVKREGVALWSELLSSIIALSNKGSIEAELVAMILRWLPEDITVHNEDLEGERRRVLLRSLTESLKEILPLLYSLIERHFAAALSECSRQQMGLAKQCASTVIASLNAVNAYAEWAPVPELAKYGLIHGCGSLLPYHEFRLHACEFFKHICQRKRPIDATGSEFDSAMSTVFQILMNVSSEFLNTSICNSGPLDESEYEFTECICESMVALGSSNMQCIVSDGTMTLQFLQQMLGYYQHHRIAFHFQSLLFWLALLRESSLKAKPSAHFSGDNSCVGNLEDEHQPTDKEKKRVLMFITDGTWTAIVDASLQRMLKKNITTASAKPLELWSDELDGKIDFSQYRSKLLEFIKFIASRKPFIAATSVIQRINTVTGSSNNISISPQDLAMMESTQLGLETVVSAIFDGSSEYLNSDEEMKLQLHRNFEGLLQHLLSLKWVEPALAVILGRYLDALGPYLRHHPDSVASVVNKIFELLTAIPITLQDPSSNNARHARLQICSSFIRISRAADKSLLPHMKGIADSMSYLQGEGHLLRGEHNLLGEAFLVMASSAGVQQQKEVLAWLLEPLSKLWTQLDWQNAYLSDPLGLTLLCCDTQFMWSIYHTVTFFEKALKRSGIKKSNVYPQGCSAAANAPNYEHPMSTHLPWMLPPLLRLLRSVHALWSESVAQSLTGELKAAKNMSSVEQASLLGESNLKLLKGHLASADGSTMDMNREGDSKEGDIRNWLRGIRDSGYNVIGMSATIGDTFFRSMEGSSTALTLLENLQSMEFRHLRLLIHLVIVPFVKHCPVDLWNMWLVNLLQPLFIYCQQALACSWSSLLYEGRAKVPDSLGNLSGLELKVEVMEEKLLRDLTREVCSLLSVIASPGLNSGLPSLEQLGLINRSETSSLKDLKSFVSSSLTGFLMLHKGPALPALKIVIEVFSWTDGEAVTKIIPFCGALVNLAISTNNIELREFVAKDLLCTVIQGLALESNAIICADLIGLCREIYVYLADRHPAPRQVILALPNITNDDLQGFEEALSKTTSPKEQKQHMRSLLVLATGNRLKALAAQKSMNAITNVTARIRTSASVSGSNVEDGLIGLAAITQHQQHIF